MIPAPRGQTFLMTRAEGVPKDFLNISEHVINVVGSDGLVSDLRLGPGPARSPFRAPIWAIGPGTEVLLVLRW